ncbi:hypothetical protein GGX14DRAFT_609535 [Mycena pura]|uniref:Uncharacterized protein n=1 Tax=Mycena pura TaxID=153505 RepID=A0AAD6VJK1_9AGAR|nr:hypothetical protein GGX14DRAFT_609535 [Mycena pura]
MREVPGGTEQELKACPARSQNMRHSTFGRCGGRRHSSADFEICRHAPPDTFTSPRPPEEHERRCHILFNNDVQTAHIRVRNAVVLDEECPKTRTSLQAVKLRGWCDDRRERQEGSKALNGPLDMLSPPLSCCIAGLSLTPDPSARSADALLTPTGGRVFRQKCSHAHAPAPRGGRTSSTACASGAGLFSVMRRVAHSPVLRAQHPEAQLAAATALAMADGGWGSSGDGGSSGRRRDQRRFRPAKPTPRPLLRNEACGAQSGLRCAASPRGTGGAGGARTCDELGAGCGGCNGDGGGCGFRGTCVLR